MCAGSDVTFTDITSECVVRVANTYDTRVSIMQAKVGTLSCTSSSEVPAAPARDTRRGAAPFVVVIADDDTAVVDAMARPVCVAVSRSGQARTRYGPRIAPRGVWLHHTRVPTLRVAGFNASSARIE